VELLNADGFCDILKHFRAPIDESICKRAPADLPQQVVVNQLAHPCVASFESSLPLKSLQMDSSAAHRVLKYREKQMKVVGFWCILSRLTLEEVNYVEENYSSLRFGNIGFVAGGL